MNPDSEGPRPVAIEQLEAFGLSAYAARTFVALVSLGESTAKDVSEAAAVPRTRVYDAVSELRERGLVVERPKSPKRFQPVPARVAGRQFEEEYVRRVDALADALVDLEPAPHGGRRVWTLGEGERIGERAVELIEGASDEVVYVSAAELLTEPLLGALADADERGVSVRGAGVSENATARLRSAVPGLEAVGSGRPLSDVPVGRLLLVDREEALVSVLGAGGARSEETAVRGTGRENGLVVTLRATLVPE
jgi:sugar-specific transcriptional regulator TrmB